MTGSPMLLSSPSVGTIETRLDGTCPATVPGIVCTDRCGAERERGEDQGGELLKEEAFGFLGCDLRRLCKRKQENYFSRAAG